MFDWKDSTTVCVFSDQTGLTRMQGYTVNVLLERFYYCWCVFSDQTGLTRMQGYTVNVSPWVSTSKCFIED